MMLDVKAADERFIVARNGLVDNIEWSAGLFCLWTDRASIAILLNDQYGMRLPRRHR